MAQSDHYATRHDADALVCIFFALQTKSLKWLLLHHNIARFNNEFIELLRRISIGSIFQDYRDDLSIELTPVKGVHCFLSILCFCKGKVRCATGKLAEHHLASF